MSACEHTPLPWSPAALISAAASRSSPAGELRALSSDEVAQGSQVIPVVTANDIAAHAMSLAPVPELSIAPCYELRPLETEAELYESYRLRYEVYGALGYLQCFNRSQLEVDAYDRTSIPFGAFDMRNGELIGTLRLITTEPQLDYDRLIENVIIECQDGELREQAAPPPKHLLPAIGSEEIERELAAFNRDHYIVHELSRFIVQPRHRYTHVSRALVQIAMAHAMLAGPAVFIAGCLPRHVRLYANYGFVKLPHTDLSRFESVGQMANTIVCRSDVLPGPMQTQVDAMLRAMTSGALEHTHELSRDSHARFRFRGSAPGTAGCTDGTRS
jgi:predicted GNAT family N-acyltransferase